jgi:hypothetical protein
VRKNYVPGLIHRLSERFWKDFDGAVEWSGYIVKRKFGVEVFKIVESG